jgi:hypothetical protein
MKIQTHHIEYDPEWTVDIKGDMHLCLTSIQRTKPTEEEYAILVGFWHAVSHECNRYRKALDAIQR